MFEATTNPRTKAAIEAAHIARGGMLRQMVRALFGPRDIPLDAGVLTEASRCPP